MKFEKYDEGEALDEAQRLKDRTGKTNPTALELDSAQKVIDKENAERRWHISSEDWGPMVYLLSELSRSGVSLPGGWTEKKIVQMGKMENEKLFEYAKRLDDDDEFLSKIPETYKNGKEYDRKKSKWVPYVVDKRTVLTRVHNILEKSLNKDIPW